MFIQLHLANDDELDELLRGGLVLQGGVHISYIQLSNTLPLFKSFFVKFITRFALRALAKRIFKHGVLESEVELPCFAVLCGFDNLGVQCDTH